MQRQRSVLVVDSHTPSRHALAQLCSLNGWSVRAAERCAPILAESFSAPLDLLIVEESPPDGSAHFLFRQLRERSPLLEAVMSTRTPSVANAVQAIRAGFRDYLGFPTDRVRLLSVLGRCVTETAVGAHDAPHFDRSLDGVQWDHIRSVLTDVGGNVSEAARVLGLHRRSLQRKLSRRA
jgi:two-component system, response regulator RegA